VPEPLDAWVSHLADDEVVCRCERVHASDLRDRIAAGERDVNALKALTRAGMGACGGKTCASLIGRLFADAGCRARR
jgi:sarcosine oxidase, subunit alpha